MKNFANLLQEIKKCNFDELKNNHSRLLKLFTEFGDINEQGFGKLNKSSIPNELIWLFNQNTQNGITSIRSLQNNYGIKYEKSSDCLSFNGILDVEKRPVIPNHIRKLLSKKCVVSGLTSNLEIDHKFDYRFYNDEAISNNPLSYQILSRNLNSKKREDFKKRQSTGIKTDNRNFGCSFSTVKNTMKYNPSEKYGGEFLEDVEMTRKLDARLYSFYFNEVNDICDIDMDVFENNILNQINNLIYTIDINDYNSILKNIKYD